jgi:hypothetical protein
MHPGELMELSQAWRGGDEQALHKLMPLVYAEFRRLARSYMNRERPGYTLQTTALAHEAYTRLMDGPPVGWQDRNHFFVACSTLMRRALVDHARSHGYRNRWTSATTARSTCSHWTRRSLTSRRSHTRGNRGSAGHVAGHGDARHVYSLSTLNCPHEFRRAIQQGEKRKLWQHPEGHVARKSAAGCYHLDCSAGRAGGHFGPD